MIGAGVLLGTVVAIFLWSNRQKPVDPSVQRLANLADLAERACLVNSSESSAVSLRVKIDAIRKVDASAGVDQQRAVARGAAQALTGELQKQENNDIRACMDPWSKQLQEMASKL
jgi:hypothetical protein